MPYIAPDARVKFHDLITETVNLMVNGNEPELIKGEFFGYWVNRITKKFIGDPNYTGTSFNSTFFNEEKRKLLANNADKICSHLNRSEPLKAAGELNYAITAVLWGVCGEADIAAEAGYGFRAYMTAPILAVSESLVTANVGNHKDMTMSFRRWMLTKKVLWDILFETGRRPTGVYEDIKLVENGDIWEEGKLVVQTGLLEAE